MSEEEDEFQFETSHLALRSNADYLKLVKHLTVLCANRIQVHNDIDRLRTAQQTALDDPAGFVDNLQRGEVDFPSRIEIPEIPGIDYSQYSNATTTSASSDPTTSLKKPLAVNFWTNEEQKQLEELLVKYPPEAVESQRFARIAKEMGNRSAKQIASRVQKFFKKLQEANLPIPGSSTSKPLKNRHRTHKNFLKLERPSTFFPERNITSDLIMKEESDDESALFSPHNVPSESSVLSRSESALALLKQVRLVKARSISTRRDSGQKCSFCSEILLKDASWHCNDCKIEFCPDCLTSKLVNESFSHFDHNFVFS